MLTAEQSEKQVVTIRYHTFESQTQVFQTIPYVGTAVLIYDMQPECSILSLFIWVFKSVNLHHNQLQ